VLARDPARRTAPPAVERWLSEALRAPLEDLLGRPAKALRAQLVQLGGELGQAAVGAPGARTQAALARLSAAIELLHAGSLIVDDVQDQSPTRRGEPSVHVRYGTPRALAAGGWSYFRALELAREVERDAERAGELTAMFVETMLAAHEGQALDVGADVRRMTQAEVVEVGGAVLALKTGALTALALAGGALVAGAGAAVVAAAAEFGRAFGVGLQMFDDVGNASASAPDEKRYEDLRALRPSWVMTYAASVLAPDAFAELVEAARALPEAAPVERVLAQLRVLSGARRAASAQLDGALARLEARLAAHVPSVDVSELARLGATVARAYG
jgi:geranylgeranyl pyrophosphate synthase